MLIHENSQITQNFNEMLHVDLGGGGVNWKDMNVVWVQTLSIIIAEFDVRNKNIRSRLRLPQKPEL